MGTGRNDMEEACKSFGNWMQSFINNKTSEDLKISFKKSRERHNKHMTKTQ